MDKIQSAIRHILTALGSIMIFVGLGEWVDAVNFVSENLDAIFSSITAILGFVTGLLGFFKDKERHELRDLAAQR